MYFELALLAYLIDGWLGELPGKHPVMWMGDYITVFEKKFYANRIMPGALLVLSLLVLTGLISLALVYLCRLLPEQLSLLGLAILASTSLACWSARSVKTSLNAWILGSRDLMRSR